MRRRRGHRAVHLRLPGNPRAVSRGSGGTEGFYRSGEYSQFHSTHGFYVHGLQLEETNFPEGWRARAIPVSDPQRTRGNIGWCVEAHDLAANKLVAYRDKDREFVRTLLAESMIDAGVLLKRVASLSVAAGIRNRAADWVTSTVDELGQ